MGLFVELRAEGVGKKPPIRRREGAEGNNAVELSPSLIPAQAGIQVFQKLIDPRLRGGDVTQQHWRGPTLPALDGNNRERSMMKIYFAGPLFTEAERAWIISVKEKIEALARELGQPVRVVWPYELVSREDATAMGPRAKYEIFRLCREELKDTDLLLALLDGPQVDDGTAWEIGYFYAVRRENAEIIGIRTDFRHAGETETGRVNTMIECSCDEITWRTEDLLNAVRRTFATVPSSLQDRSNL